MEELTHLKQGPGVTPYHVQQTVVAVFVLIPDFIYLGPLFFLDSYLFFFFFSLIATVGGSGGKECACNVGDPGLIPGLGRYPGEGNDNPLLYSSLENPMDRGAWWVVDSA